MTLLCVKNMCLSFEAQGKSIEVLRGVDLHLAKGELLGLVGESGSGKSLTGLSLLGLTGPSATVTTDVFSWDGRQVAGQGEKAWRDLRGLEIGMVFQSPKTCLNPHYKIGSQLQEVLRVRGGQAKAESIRRSKELLSEVGLDDIDRVCRSYPHELSGGMNQRVMIALAIALDPKLLIADEATTALDVTTQKKVLDLLRQLATEREMAVLFISHDLDVVGHLCDRVNVMYAGLVVESGAVHQVLESPKHPYSEGLLRARPRLSFGRGELLSIPGQPPAMGEAVSGCAFAPRCPHVIDCCQKQIPLFQGTQEDGVCCHLNQGAGLL